MTHTVALITDTTADIPDALLAQYAIDLVPLTVVWGEETFLDHVELSAEAFYEGLPTNPAHPQTSQPSPHDFVQAYNQAAAAGAQEIVVIVISAALSGTCQSALQAATLVDMPVHVVDSMATCGSLAFQVLAAARAREQGAPTPAEQAQAMLAAADAVRAKVCLYVALDTLEYLRLGGRIGNASALIGSLFDIKPLIQVPTTTGTVEPVQRVRSRKRSLQTLYRTFFEQLDATRPLHVAVLHGAAPDEAQRLADRIRDQYDPLELWVNHTGPVLGVHTGPGTVALAGYSE